MKTGFRLLVLGAGLVPAVLYPNSAQILDQDNFATARGNADAATASRPSAVFYNPAGLVAQAAPAFASSVHVIDSTVDYVSPRGAAFSMVSRTRSVPSAFLAVPLGASNGRHVTLGLGAYVPFGLASQWPDATSTFRTLVTQNRFTYSTEAVALGYPLTPQLSLGASFQFDHLHADLNRGLGRIPTDRFHFVGAGETVSFSAGLLWQPSPRHSFGAKFQSKSDLHLSGTINVDPPGLAYPASVTWAFPESFVVAYSFRPDPTWNLEFDYQWINWGRMKNLVFTSPSAASMTQMFDWNASSTGGFGVTHALGGGWELSGGYEIVANSVPTRTFTPAGADMTHHFFSLGPRLTLGHWNFSLTVQADPSESRVVAGSTPSLAGQTADGTYTSHYWSGGLSVMRRF